MLERTYAIALRNALARGRDATKLVDGLLAHLKATGRIKLLPRIKKMLVEEEAHEKKHVAVLEVARKEDEAGAREEAQAAGIEVAEVRIDDSLIRGWRVRSKGMLVDRSAKNSLVELYRHITS
jgi:F0F1-type ATP synthase delta subunit